MRTEPDTDLIKRLRRGDEAAFALVYEAEKAVVYGFLSRLSRDASVAADLFQNVWLKLARHAPRLRDDSNLRAWLLTVARREYLSHRRAEALDLSRVLAFDRARPEAVGAADAEGQALLDALGRLSDADREVLLLAVQSGLDSDAQAAALGVTAVALRQRLARARRRLAQLLEADAEPGAVAATTTKGARR